MLSEEKTRDILKSVRSIGANNAGVEEAAHLLAEVMKEGVVWKGHGYCHEKWGGKAVIVSLPTGSFDIGNARDYPGLDGKDVCVTVTLEEPTDDRS